MIRNLRSFVLILALLSVTEMFGQEPVEPLDPNQPLVLVFSTGDWTWARALKRMGPALEYYTLGFRVASIPEPSTFLMSLIFGAISITATRYRRRK